jgi:hypothetical protein
MNGPKMMYRAHAFFGSLSIWHPDTAAGIFCSQMELSNDGQSLSVRRIRLDKSGYETYTESISQYWQPSEALAAAAISSRLRAIGERLVRQADEIDERAAVETSRPALASESL